LLYHIIKYLAYLKSSKTRFSIHSPFVFDFIEQVLRDNSKYNEYQMMDAMRNKMLANTSTIETTEFGTGKYETQKSISFIAKKFAQKPKYQKLLFRIVRYYKPQSILEIGTSIGLTTSALSMANPSSTIVTLEGCPETLKIAETNFSNLSRKNIQTIQGNFNQELPEFLKSSDTIDFAYIDGNHTKEATLNYFNLILKKTNTNSILVFDDINWSKGMNEAWKEIITNPLVTVSIDLFQLGIVFFNDKLSKEDFTIRY
jgi:predicted O-methyltransferase YrrM